MLSALPAQRPKWTCSPVSTPMPSLRSQAERGTILWIVFHMEFHSWPWSADLPAGSAGVCEAWKRESSTKIIVNGESLVKSVLTQLDLYPPWTHSSGRFCESVFRKV